MLKFARGSRNPAAELGWGRGSQEGRMEDGWCPMGRGCWRDGGRGRGVRARARGNLNKLQREWNSVSFCLVSSCHSGRSGSAQEVGEARQGCGEGEMREGEDAETSNLGTVNIRRDAAQVVT